MGWTGAGLLILFGTGLGIALVLADIFDRWWSK